jgi:hypothetical protein
MLLEGLASIGRKLPRQAVALATDDEAAVLLAEGATQLSEWFVLSRVRAWPTSRLGLLRSRTILTIAPSSRGSHGLIPPLRS